MCGLAAIFTHGSAAPQVATGVLARITAAMAKRGPEKPIRGTSPHRWPNAHGFARTCPRQAKGVMA